MTRLRTIAFLAATLVALSGSAALGYYSSTGSGAGVGNIATLASPGPVSAASDVVGWQEVGSPSGLDDDVTYTVERSGDGGATWSPADDECTGAIPQSTTSCTDTPPAGEYSYRVTASFRTWTRRAASE